MTHSQQILGATHQNILETAAVNLPQINNLKRTIYLQRKGNDLPLTPLSRKDIPILPERYQVTKSGERYLIFDNGVGDNERILIFAIQQGIHFLSDNSHQFMDETFKLCPEIFYQIYTVHTLNINQVFPCVFALLPNKKLKIQTTNLAEKSRMLSSDRGMNLLIFSQILKELQ